MLIILISGGSGTFKKLKEFFFHSKLFRDSRWVEIV